MKTLTVEQRTALQLAFDRFVWHYLVDRSFTTKFPPFLPLEEQRQHSGNSLTTRPSAWLRELEEEGRRIQLTGATRFDTKAEKPSTA
jgi:hypothetical protein